jgi:hypothetical protein
MRTVPLDLRHFAASALRDAGMDNKMRSVVIGHSDASAAVYTSGVDLRSVLRRLFGRSADRPESSPPPDYGDTGEPKTIEETLDDIKEDQTPETGRGLP